MTDIVVQLGSVTKYRNREEYHSIPRASCEFDGISYEHIAWGEVIRPLLRKLPLNKAQFDSQVVVLRGGTTSEASGGPESTVICFELMTVTNWLNPVKKEMPKGLKAWRVEMKLKSNVT